MIRRCSPRYHILCLLMVGVALASSGQGQTRIITQQNGQAVVIDEAQFEVQSPRGGRPSGKPPQLQQPAGGPQPGPSEKKEEGQPGEAKPGGEPAAKSDQPTNVQRSSEPPEPPDPQELRVEPDAEGLLRFQFRNQPWPDVVRWFAEVSGRSLDWQELPGDYINLATQRPFTMEETGDMINRALLARGFTLLHNDGVLTVAKVENLNPSMVPRVRPEDLANTPPHSFVRTSFPLTWLIAEEVHEEFASMVSKNGKLTPLTSTNRLEAIDAAANLRDIYEILEQEQSAIALENLAREFPLRHARASMVKLQLEEFLGINSPASSRSSGGDMMRMMQQQMQQQMQQMQQQMQQAQQGGNKGSAARRQRSDDVYLVANDRSNSVIVHASPDKMAIVASFIARVDVPNENAADFQRMNTRMKVFRLASLSPAELVASLVSMDVLEPTTRLQVDENNNAIIAYASVADQYLIQSVIDRLDGSERTFEVIPLKRLDAEAVAGSIKFLMGAEEEEDNNNSRRNYGYFDFYGGRNSQPEKKADKMRVGANVQDNQVLLWANAIEMEEVQKLLVKLGEIPPEGGRRSTMRIIDASRQPETYQYLMRLKEQWERMSPNPLVLPEAKEFVPAEEEADKEAPATDGSSPLAPSGAAQPQPEKKLETPDKVTQAAGPAARKLISTPHDEPAETPPAVADAPQPDTTVPAASAASTEPTAAVSNSSPSVDQDTFPPGRDANAFNQPGNRPPTGLEPPAAEPIAIMIDEAGNLVIQSNDTAALDRLEEMMSANRPPRRPYDIFKVKYARASWVALNLRDYFEREDDNDSNRFFSFFYGGRPPKDESQQLGKRPPLRFIYDNDTSSIVVQGADDLDRKTIQELIDLWDVPEPDDGEDDVRYTKLLRINYSRADAIVNTIKEAYRDLLSANDKSVQPPSENNEDKRSGNGGGVQAGGGMSFAFKGKLSLGADTITNSILVSAEGDALLQLVCDMIKELDEAARPQGNFEVYTLTPEINNAALERALRSMLQLPSQQQPQPNQPQPGQQPNPQDNAPARGQVEFSRGSPSNASNRGRGR